MFEIIDGNKGVQVQNNYDINIKWKSEYCNRMDVGNNISILYNIIRCMILTTHNLTLVAL